MSTITDKMRLMPIVLAALFFLSREVPTQAQPSAFRVVHQMSAALPDSAVTAFFLDGKLYCAASGVVLQAEQAGGQVLRFTPDTLLLRYDENIDYAVRHPVTFDLYFTTRDRKGRSALYVRPFGKGKKNKARRVELDGLEISHPVFATDGRTMVFSSSGREGRHDYDLWYARQTKDGWGEPHRLGTRVNTGQDETEPVICGNNLFFVSRGHSDDGLSHLFVTPLFSPRLTGDTVGMPRLGAGPVVRMPSPFNGDGASSSLVLDTVGSMAHWLFSDGNRRDAHPLYSYSGDLRARFLWGYVRDVSGAPLPGTAISVLRGSAEACSTQTDSLGFYSIYLPSSDDFKILFRHPGCFIDTLPMDAVQPSGGLLVTELQRDITLGSLPLRTPFFYLDLFGPGASTTLSSHGVAMLAPLVRFLRDNPTCSVTLSLCNDLTHDRTFNSLLTDQRIAALRDHLSALLPATVRVTILNLCTGDDGCNTASGLSRLVVVLD